MNADALTWAVLAEDQWDVLKILVIGGLIVGGILAYHALDVLGNNTRVKQTEATKRELAAYVAEGSITPETAERLLAAGAPTNWSEQVAGLLQTGMIDSSQAEKLLRAGPGSGPAPGAVPEKAAARA